ncbi:MAG: rRNA (guanosine2251-2-O)-methyltransferase [Actinomycetota bacterium]|nr:rRNA (guanosine2251-2-O)-methyltransferase [Actinomycetota bacterium]
MAEPQRGGTSGLVSGRRAVEELLASGNGAQKILIVRDRAGGDAVARIRKLAGERDVPVRIVPKEEVERVAEGLNHQGVVALTGAFQYSALEDVLSNESAKVLFVDRVTDPHNLGSLLRSADGAGFHGVVVPVHRAAPVTDVVRRVSSGASEVVPVVRVSNIGRALEQAKDAGLWIAGLDADGDADLWESTLLNPPVGLVLGSEQSGLGPAVAKRCDGIVKIPSSGRLDSLNVAVAGAVAMFEVARREADASSLTGRGKIT